MKEFAKHGGFIERAETRVEVRTATGKTELVDEARAIQNLMKFLANERRHRASIMQTSVSEVRASTGGITLRRRRGSG